MASLAPGFIRVTYSNTYGIHHIVLPVNYVGTPVQGIEPDLLCKDATAIGAVAGLASFMTPYKAFFDNTTDFGLAEAYAVEPDDEERSFLYGWNLAASGTAISANVFMGMATLTWKTTTGGVIKIVAMEGVTTPNQKVFAPYTPASPPDVLSDYMVSGASIVYGRGNAYAFAPISQTSKISDALRKREGLA